MMRMRYRILTLVAAGSLTLNGCGKADISPPPNASTDTPVLDIEQGTEVAPEEIGKKAAAASDAAGTGAQTDAGVTPSGQ